MPIDRERTSQSQPQRTEPNDELFARIAEAYEADGASVERVKLRARSGERPERDPGLRPLALRVAVATALTLLLAVGVWRFPSTTTPPLDVHDPATTTPQVDDDGPTLVISNADGFVTVQAGGSQWIVLPGDTP
ncbi:MAG: hypothetical protein AAFY88_28100 [Acidobacteriota bacterium]